MKIFVSWSGNRSKKFAQELKNWLQIVLQATRPFVSSRDLSKGTIWFDEISKELKGSDFGIICLTKAEISSPWINFEAGAIANKLDDSNVTAILIDLSPSDVTGPLAQFQHTLPEKDDMLSLIKTLNNALDEEKQLTEELLEDSFDNFWPRFEEILKFEPENSGEEVVERTERDILNEILQLSRDTAQNISKLPDARDKEQNHARRRAIEYLTNKDLIGDFSKKFNRFENQHYIKNYKINRIDNPDYINVKKMIDFSLTKDIITLIKANGDIETHHLFDLLELDYPIEDIKTSLSTMMKNKIIEWESGPENFEPDEIISLV